MSKYINLYVEADCQMSNDIETPFLYSVTLLRDKIKNFDSFPFTLPIINNFNSITLHPKITFLVGENGSGKSTLLEAIAIACGFNAEGGTKNFTFSTKKSHTDLWKNIRLSRSFRQQKDGFFLRAESFYNLATEIVKLDEEPALAPPIIASYGNVSLHEQSHGEAFLAVMLHRFQGQGLYILDEPESALSPTRQMAMIKRIHELINQGSQFIIATHSPILMAYPNAKILSLDEQKITTIQYNKTDHFTITKYFLNNHEKMINYLLEEN
ncbi:AAA family ATPase [Pseudomonas sp. F1_0610]|uniref:AAA family ATPase n=1 Tax=Pseudomonas sp. F1_0610 TaxID=3114284 RepID=UPI0039C35F92